MESKLKITLQLDKTMMKKLGITEDTLFQTSFADGKVILESIDENDICTEDDEDYECEGSCCHKCRFFCDNCKKCVFE